MTLNLYESGTLSH